MIALFSFILVLVGCANWLTIGLLQFDFVAGIFGSQSNIFSRIVYVIVGVAALVVIINLIKHKGKLTFNLKKLKMNNTKPLAVGSESGDDSGKSNNANNNQDSKVYKNSKEQSHKKNSNKAKQISHIKNLQEFAYENGKGNNERENGKE